MTTETAGHASTQSLARGAAGIALLRIEQAMTGTGRWADARAAITAAAAEPVDTGHRAALYIGAPALAFVLHAARADGQPRYEVAARELGGHVLHAARRRLAAAQAGRSRGQISFRDFDVFYGIAGIAALLAHTAPGSDALGGMLEYLTQLVMPRTLDGTRVPGWLVSHDPDPLVPTPGGHVNLGMAHGAAGLLAVLSLTARRNIAVQGQSRAIDYLRGFFSRWRQDAPGGPWWPQWLTRDDLRAGVPGQPGPGRPSWCYGAAGIGRALQLAAITTADVLGQSAAEDSLAACISPVQLARITSPGLCHGSGGLYVTAQRAAHDALTPVIAQRLPTVASLVAAQADAADGAGLLTGDAGIRLALETARAKTPPRSGWDACLLIT